jgi:hypothetical protein
MKLGRLFFASGSLVLLTFACVGGPGQLPDDQGQQQQGGTGNTTTTSPAPSSNGGTGSTGSGGATGGSSGASGSSGTGTNIKRTIAGSEFNQSCSGESTSECTAVFFGGTCTPCQCPNGAINSGEGEKYKKTMAERTAGCAIPDIACSPCQPKVAICVANTCQVANSAPDGG